MVMTCDVLGTGPVDTEECVWVSGGIVARGLHYEGRWAPALTFKMDDDVVVLVIMKENARREL